MKRILVTGAYGFLGPILCANLENSGHTVFRQGRKPEAQIHRDPSVPFVLDDVIDQCEPDVLINLIANADVDGCERDPEAAYQANVDVVRKIAEAVVPRAVHLIHLSSDHLYNGPGPSSEEMAHPVNSYARTKFEGEAFAMAAGATVLRTNFVGKSVVAGRRSLSDWIVACLVNAVPFSVFRDVYFSPLHVSTVCRCIELAAVRQHEGVYNLGAKGGVSKADFAASLADLLGADRRNMVVGNYFDNQQAVPRPKDMTMAVEKFETTFDCILPEIDSQIRLLADEYGVRCVTYDVHE